MCIQLLKNSYEYFFTVLINYVDLLIVANPNIDMKIKYHFLWKGKEVFLF